MPIRHDPYRRNKQQRPHGRVAGNEARLGSSFLRCLRLHCSHTHNEWPLCLPSRHHLVDSHPAYGYHNGTPSLSHRALFFIFMSEKFPASPWEHVRKLNYSLDRSSIDRCAVPDSSAFGGQERYPDDLLTHTQITIRG